MRAVLVLSLAVTTAIVSTAALAAGESKAELHPHPGGAEAGGFSTGGSDQAGPADRAAQG